MPTLSTILFVAAFGQPLAFLAGAAGLYLSYWLGLDQYGTTYWVSCLGVAFGYMLRANEKPGKSHGLTEGK